jgi:hypothetical protein
MKTHAIGFLMSLCMLSCSAQESEQNSPSASSENEIGTTTNQPKVSWKVNKEVDEDGNVIRYDSTYTWSYTNVEGDSMSVDMDSMMQSFNNYFDQHFSPMWNSSFNSPFRNDTLFHQDFFNDNFFQNRWENDFYDMDNLFHRMDSLRNRFFNESYPGFIQPHLNDSNDNH